MKNTIKIKLPATEVKVQVATKRKALEEALDAEVKAFEELISNKEFEVSLDFEHTTKDTTSASKKVKWDTAKTDKLVALWGDSKKGREIATDLDIDIKAVNAKIAVLKKAGTIK